MKIAIASGKGGTGKTTISVNLFYFIEKYFTTNVTLIDCDVEEPNAALFFPDKKQIYEKQVFHLIPEIDTDKCTFCKKCSDWCEFNAITIVKNLKFAKVNHDLCHSCGACLVACNNKAVIEKQQPLGFISHFNVGIGNGIKEGRLEIGSAMQTSLIKYLKKEPIENKSVIIFDAPPGNSCPVVETVSDSDYIILVTEPTPFGLHDLKITVELLNELKKPFGIIINKAGLGSSDIYTYISLHKMELLGEIPFSKEYASHYASGNILNHFSVEMEQVYKKIVEKLKTKFTVQ